MPATAASPEIVRVWTPERIAADIEGYLRAREQLELVRFVVVGSVDDGKSTLIGRLLYETGSLYEDHIEQARQASTQKQSVDIDFSLFTDGLKAEREQGITIDVAYRHFASERRKFIIADTPGHLQYTRNMATGASTSDVAVILIDARLGVLGQSRRHAYIASLLGIRQLAVCVNKMDLVEWSEARYREIAAEFRTFSQSLGFAGVTFFPISAKQGDNVVTPSERTPWHAAERASVGDATVLAFLETVPVARDPARETFRFPVQYVLRPHLDYRGFAGQIASGRVREGDDVVVLPSGRRTCVRSVDVVHSRPEGRVAVVSVPEASAPMSVTVRLADEVDVSRGDLIVHATALPNISRAIEATVVWLDERPLDKRRAFLLKHASRVVPARVAEVLARTDLESLTESPVEGEPIEMNEIARVVVETRRPFAWDPYEANRSLGAFVLIDALTNDTVAAGMIRGQPTTPRAADTGEGPEDLATLVPPDERRSRLSQSGAIVWIDSATGSGWESAWALERALFDQGAVAHVLSARVGVEALTACADAGIVVLCVAGHAPVEMRAAVGVGGCAVVDFESRESDEMLAARVERAIARLRAADVFVK